MERFQKRLHSVLSLSFLPKPAHAYYILLNRSGKSQRCQYNVGKETIYSELIRLIDCCLVFFFFDVTRDTLVSSDTTISLACLDFVILIDECDVNRKVASRYLKVRIF